jgi:hypothetical protein
MFLLYKFHYWYISIFHTLALELIEVLSRKSSAFQNTISFFILKYKTSRIMILYIIVLVRAVRAVSFVEIRPKKFVFIGNFFPIKFRCSLWANSLSICTQRYFLISTYSICSPSTVNNARSVALERLLVMAHKFGLTDNNFKPDTFNYSTGCQRQKCVVYKQVY